MSLFEFDTDKSLKTRHKRAGNLLVQKERKYVAGRIGFEPAVHHSMVVKMIAKSAPNQRNAFKLLWRLSSRPDVPRNHRYDRVADKAAL